VLKRDKNVQQTNSATSTDIRVGFCFCLFVCFLVAALTFAVDALFFWQPKVPFVVAEH